MKWLSPCDVIGPLLSASSVRQEGTGQWFLQSHGKPWTRVVDEAERTRVVWLRGKPGSGKTVLNLARATANGGETERHCCLFLLLCE